MLLGLHASGHGRYGNLVLLFRGHQALGDCGASGSRGFYPEDMISELYGLAHCGQNLAFVLAPTAFGAD
jgi:hypothetical protein